jgi:hypothetical protein
MTVVTGDRCEGLCALSMRRIWPSLHLNLRRSQAQTRWCTGVACCPWLLNGSGARVHLLLFAQRRVVTRTTVWECHLRNVLYNVFKKLQRVLKEGVEACRLSLEDVEKEISRIASVDHVSLSLESWPDHPPSTSDHSSDAGPCRM